MLKELNRYENLGTPKFFHELFKQIHLSDGQWKKENIKEYFYNRIIDDQAIFDGCLPLAEKIGAIIVNQQGLINVSPTLYASLISEAYLSSKLLEMIFVALKNDLIFYEIFCPENISYDIIYRIIQINNTAFGFQYANFRKLLVSFGFLYPHPSQNIKNLIVNPKYKKLFDRELLPEIKKRKVGIEELEKTLEQRQIYGQEAEIFVLEYEKVRLGAHYDVSSIERISEYDVGAGYDILSFEAVDSSQYDRFIEVKSYANTISFHWSRNEIDIARIKKDRYFLYLIDRNKMAMRNYAPVIIQNPYEKIIKQSSEWEKIPDSYFIIKTVR